MKQARLARSCAAMVPVLVCLSIASRVAARSQPTDPPAPLTAAEMADFLSTAEVVSSAPLSVGVTRPFKLTLKAGALTHDAAFQAIDQNVPMQRLADGRTELNFRDSYHFNIAAYRLAELLGLGDMVPVTVERKWNGRTGALAWWVDAKWDETKRMKEGIHPPDPVDWAMQQSRMRVFSELVYDTDRNTGNQLITEDWHLWMIDFTRAFRLSNKLLREDNVQRCSRDMLAAMKALTVESVSTATAPHLTSGEIKSLLKRRDVILERVDGLVKQRGESLVLF